MNIFEPKIFSEDVLIIMAMLFASIKSEVIWAEAKNLFLLLLITHISIYEIYYSANFGTFLDPCIQDLLQR